MALRDEQIRAILQGAFEKRNLIIPVGDDDKEVFTPEAVLAVNNRSLAFINPDYLDEHLTGEELADKGTTPEEKARTSHFRAGEQIGRRLRDLEDTELYSDLQIAGFIDNAFTVLSSGGRHKTDCVIAAVRGMGLTDIQKREFLAKHLAWRATERRAFQETWREDIALVKAEFNGYEEEMKALLAETIAGKIASTNTFKKVKIGMFDSPDYLRAFDKLGLDKEDVRGRFDRMATERKRGIAI